MNLDAADIARDRRLRFRMLRLLNSSRNSAVSIRGHVVRDLLDGLNSGDDFEEDGHVIGLLRDLENADYVALEDKRTRTNERFGLSFLDCRITAKGTRFLAGGERPDSLIDDGRIVREA